MNQKNRKNLNHMDPQKLVDDEGMFHIHLDEVRRVRLSNEDREHALIELRDGTEIWTEDIHAKRVLAALDVRAANRSGCLMSLVSGLGL